ncbi:MAG TPA: amino acid permease [Candidatus Acidoferrales bacterium]|nr:amino acid permease [Candidatus Acidoferrales bacterium]
MESQFFRTKSIDKLLADAEEPDRRLRKTLGVLSLMALGIGAIIGTGIFVLTGTAAAGEAAQEASLLKTPLLTVVLHGGREALTGRPGAGPAIALSFFLVAIACGLAGLCYAELSSMIPIAGSAYTYTYATLGELVAWIIGWDLILEYAVSNMAVAVGFSAYIKDLFSGFGMNIPIELGTPAYTPDGGWTLHFNLVGFVVVMILTVLLVRGIKESARANTIMVGVKLTAILLFVFIASKYIHPEHWHPFMPNGWQGVMTGGAIVFFTYIGFDSVSTAAEECKNPKRDLPLGILLSLLVCTILYVSVAVVLTGIQPYQIFRGDAAPVATALHNIHLDGLRRWVTIGALMGMISSLLVFQLGQARVWFAMSRDRLLPDAFSSVHPTFRTPHVATWVAGLFVGIPAGIFDIGTLADLSNIGTLFAFLLVSLAVLILRRTQAERARSFHVPVVWFVAPASVACCLVLMMGLPLESWIRFVVWLIIGMLFYLSYGARRSTSGSELAAADRLRGLAKADRALVALASLLVLAGLILAAAMARGSVEAGSTHVLEACVLVVLGAPFVSIGLRNLRKDS